MEFEQLPEDCKQALGDIQRILDSAKKLEVIVAIAPDLIGRTNIPDPRTAFGLMKLLWAIGKPGWDARHRGAKVKAALVDRIVINRISQIIDIQLLQHDNNPELRTYWKGMQEVFGSN